MSKSNKAPKMVNQEELETSKSFLKVLPNEYLPIVAQEFYDFCTGECSHEKFIATCNKYGLYYKCQTFYMPNTLEGLEGDDYMSYIFESEFGKVFMKNDEELHAYLAQNAVSKEQKEDAEAELEDEQELQ